MIQARTSKRGRHHLPEVALYRGPAAIGEVGSGSYADLFGHKWACVWDKARGLLLYKEIGAVWAEQTSPEPLPTLQKTDRHLSVQSDQAARPVIAWESSGTLWVWFWNPITAVFDLEGVGPGLDPVLLMDAQINGITSNSDVVLFYLSPSRTTIHYRLQRDRWGIEYTLATLPEPMYLDQAIALPWRYELWLGSDTTPSVALRSALYPVDVGTESLNSTVSPLDGHYLPARLDNSASEALSGQIEPRPGTYMPAAIYPLARLEALAGQIEPRPGAYALAVIRANPATEALAGQIEPRPGAYALAVIRANPATEALAGQIEPRPGAYALAVIRANPATEALAGQIEPRPGAYALAVIRANPATEALAGQIEPLNGRYHL
ncbi:hypothetical protein [Meiothermus sp.]|uniref:hypothetical protein n=1 Tax=Meiothermus sp. TaxID=1955249 RepID=UPI0021DBDDF0|nr:hypothetical protein [Meiothermus sp.]GIW25786.1 MAG: hypothetical protein KatS3mg069_2053 [Meiothermus sp.]